MAPSFQIMTSSDIIKPCLNNFKFFKNMEMIQTLIPAVLCMYQTPFLNLKLT